MKSASLTMTAKTWRTTWWRRGLAWILGPGWETSVILLLVLQTAWIAASAARHTPIVDEPVHLAAGLRFWETGEFDLNRGNPPLVDWLAAIPASFAHAKTDWAQFPNSFLCSQDFMRINGTRALDYVIWGRWMLLPIGALGGWICALWARELYGRHAGLLAVVMWCACPLLIANTELITGDIPSTVAAVSTMYAGWLWMRQPTWGRAVVLGLVLGIAELTKFVCIVLYPSLFLTWLIWRLFQLTLAASLGVPASPKRILNSTWSNELLQGIVATLISIVVINTGYRFDKTLQPLAKHGISKYLIKSQVAPSTEEVPGDQSESNAALPNNLPWWAHIPVPLPLNYLGGANEISQLFEHQHPTYFLGRWIPGGVWYYYVVGLIWKLPVGTLVLIALALLYTWPDERLRRKWPREVALILPCVVFFVFISYITTVKYLRYGLPVLPYLIIYSSKCAHWILKGPRIVGAGICCLATWAIVATVAIYPHQGSYFNELVGGPENGAEYMIESSIDWGQDLFFLKDWLEDHPDSRPFYLAYFGNCDPRDAGISFQLPTFDAGLQFTDDQAGSLTPGYYAISKSLLQGFEWPAVPDGNGEVLYVRGVHLGYLKSCPIVGRAGHSILIFQMTPEKVAELRLQAKSRRSSSTNKNP